MYECMHSKMKRKFNFVDDVKTWYMDCCWQIQIKNTKMNKKH